MKMVELGTVVDNFDGKRIPLKSSDRDNLSKIYPYFGASGIIDHVDKYLFDGEYLLISEDGANLLSRTTPIAFVVNGKFWVNNHAHIVQGKEGVIINKYLEYFLNSKDISNYVTGSAQPKLNQEKLNSIQIPLPPLSTQKKIAAILDAADAYLQKTKALIEKYDRLAQSLFLEMFGDPVRNEKGWEISKIGSICKVQGGFSFKSEDYTTDGIRLVKITNVHFEDIDWTDTDYLPLSYLDKHADFSLKEGDILLALTRPIIKSLGTVKAVSVKKDDLPSLLNQRVGRFLLKSEKIHTKYLLRIIYSDYFKKLIEKFSSTSLQPNVSNSQIEDIDIMLPPLSLQTLFADRITLIDQQKQQAQQSLAKAEALFNSLLQRAFKGELVS